MPQLILDEAAMRLAMAKLPGSPIFVGPDGGLLAPGVVDLVEGEHGDGDQWQPADPLTRRLVLGAEACRDIVFHAPSVLERRTRRRAMKTLTVPVCSLMDVVEGLRREMNDDKSRAHRLSWPKRDQQTYTRVGRRLRKTRLQGPVRKVRHKLGAHLDPEAFDVVNRKLSADDLLGAMGDALILLNLSLNYPSEFFGWIRWLGTVNADRAVVETMFSYPACVRWVVDGEGRVVDVLPVRLAEDPRGEIEPDLRSAVVAYNEMIGATGSSMSPISFWATDDLRELEK